MELTMPELDNAAVANSYHVPSELRDWTSKFDIMTYRKGKASPHTMMV